MKNIEIIAEIITEEVCKFDKLITRQRENIQEFSNSIERADTISLKTDRLEEIVEHWNNLFERQKTQIKALQGKQISENRYHRVITYLLLVIIVSILIIKNI